MDKASVNRYHAMLNGKRLELQERLDAARKQKIEASLSEAKDEGDRATAALAAEMTVAQQAQTESLIKVIAAALRRIDEGTFGQCPNCGGEIGSKRLEALPWTRYCITCQELIDGN
jgi:DnaK suppressor protein